MARNSIVTPPFRATYLSLFEPVTNKDDPTGPKSYVVSAIFDPSTDLSALRAEERAVAEAKWGVGKVPKNLKSAFRLNSELNTPKEDFPDDAVIMTFKCQEKYHKPDVIDKHKRAITDSMEVYPGAWFRAEVSGYAYAKEGSRGVAFGLVNIQKLKDDEPIGATRRSAASVFDEYLEPGETSAESIFG